MNERARIASSDGGRLNRSAYPDRGGDAVRGAVLPWYVARTKVGQERVAHDNLQRLGYRVYLPTVKVLPSGNHEGEARPCAAFEPMFRRYVFFSESSAHQSIAPVRSTAGISTVMRFGAQSIRLGTGILQLIQDLERQQHLAGFRAPTDEVRPRCLIELESEPLTSLENLISEVSGDRVMVLLHLLALEASGQLISSQLMVNV